MARELRVEIVGDARDLERELGRAEKSSSKFQAGLGKGSAVAAGGLAALAVGAKGLADDASDLGESVNAVNVVFEEGADKVLAFAKIAATEAGLSMRSFNELVTPVGASLRNVGFSADEAAESSIALAKRAADMASVFNVDVSEALSAIQAGLRGEADPLERFGVGLSAAAVEAQALSMGLGKTKEDLTANELAQARLALLMKQTDKVAGDFKGTSDGLANSQRINAAEAENQRAAYGEGVLPVMQTLQGVMRSLLGVLAEHKTATTIAVGVATALAAAVLVVNGAVRVYQTSLIVARAAQAVFNATMAANPIGLVIVALVALGAGLVLAYQKSETFRDIVNGVFTAVKNAVVGAINLVLGVIDKYLGGIQKMLEVASKLPFVGDKFKGIAESVGDAREKIRDLQGGLDGLKSKDITVTTTLITRKIEIYDRVEGNRADLPGRAAGGPVRAGHAYVVGERRPELFVPDVDGQIIPRVPDLANVSTLRADARGATPGGDLVLMVDGQVFARIARKYLQEEARRLTPSSVLPSFGGRLGLT